MIDMFASEYGWTANYITSQLSIEEIIALSTSIKQRYARIYGKTSTTPLNNDTINRLRGLVPVEDAE